MRTNLCDKIALFGDRRVPGMSRTRVLFDPFRLFPTLGIKCDMDDSRRVLFILLAFNMY